MKRRPKELPPACQYEGCKKQAEVEVSGLALSKPGWWRMCANHRRVFAAQRPLSPKIGTRKET